MKIKNKKISKAKAMSHQVKKMSKMSKYKINQENF